MKKPLKNYINMVYCTYNKIMFGCDTVINNLSNKAKQNAIKPFWSWNDKLEAEELCRQIEIMKKNGIEGFFMHARGGLITEYMSEDWFDKIEVCLDKADELGMQAWAYDENGWPSGFANGLVPQKGVKYQQKHLKYTIFSPKTELPENIIGIYSYKDGEFTLKNTANNGDIIISYIINPYYIDIMNADVIKDFINETYEKYYEKFADRFGTSLKGFFTDEPALGNSHIAPWSFVLPEKFEEKYNYSLIENLPLLYNDTDFSFAFRYDFYSLVNELFTESYFKQIYEWCEAHNCKFTGHSMMEDNLSSQMAANYGVMPSYEYMHEPGIDWLFRITSKNALTAKQLGSIAAQLNKKTMTETFAGCGWDVSLNELKGIAQFQYLHGVTSVCTHLESYSTRGERKRDWPASLFIQQPWFDNSFKQFADYFTKLGALLDEGNEYAPLLVIHPIKSAYASFNLNNLSVMGKINRDFVALATELNGNHLAYHYGDETILKHYGKVADKLIEVGRCKYTSVLLPDMLCIDESTLNLLIEFSKNGGKIYAYRNAPTLVNGRANSSLNKLNITTVNDIKELKIILNDDKAIITEYNDDLNCAIKTLPDGTDIYHLVNIKNEAMTNTIRIKGKKSIKDFCPISENIKNIALNYEDGYTVFTLEFAPYGSFVLEVNDGVSSFDNTAKTKIIKLDSNFKIASMSANTVTLDKCEYKINNGEWQDKKYILHIQKELLALRKPCTVELRYKFNVSDEEIINGLRFFTETPEKYEISINGKKADFSNSCQLYDKSVLGIDISDFVSCGENQIVLKCEFWQNDNVYRLLFTHGVHEAELNKLTYDSELEACYLTGNFGVKFEGECTYGDKKAIFCDENYSLVKPTDIVDITKITEQNFWFFQGEMELTQNICVNKNDNTNYYIGFKELNCPAAHIYINDKFAGDISFAPHKVDATNLLVDGENKVTVKLFSGNRNILGPHHRIEGELYCVNPSAFTDTNKADGTNAWNDGYAFVKFGAEPY